MCPWVCTLNTAISIPKGVKLFPTKCIWLAPQQKMCLSSSHLCNIAYIGFKCSLGESIQPS